MVSEWPANKVRDTFIKFFEEKNHVYWNSSPVIPVNDPRLLFANAGMNQFKPIFLGIADPSTSLSKLTRACNTQKCIRARDDDVGKDTYHHTFFEMLGNWSFGDYFKEEAIGWAWELLTTVFKLPTDRIYVTYFGGDDKLGLPPDYESRDIWLKYVPHARLLPFGSKDNFWEIDDTHTGPCGPSTEIHFDRLGGRDAAHLVNTHDPTVIEIWNNLFIQFNREKTDGPLKDLPAKHVDAGMGLERLTSILQNKMSNYDTDLFLPIFDAIQLATGARPYSGKVGPDDVDGIDMAYRVVADHVRTLSFAIAEGSCPGNEGHQYVLRRILRRALLYGRKVLRAEPGFFNGLVEAVVTLMRNVFPELKQQEAHITEIIAEEESSFEKTLHHGFEKFKRMVKDDQRKIISGQEAFLFWDTFGFPLDLTQLLAEENGLVVEVDGFNLAMSDARERSRNTGNKQSDVSVVMDANATSALHKRGVATTNDSFKFNWFEDHTSVIEAIYTGSKYVECVDAGVDVAIVLESTSFYAEQGGQIYDTGLLEGPSGSFEVCSVQVYGGFVIHLGKITGEFHVGTQVICKVDYERRQRIAANHTCTHMLNFALREVLGDDIHQKGSIVLPEKLRLDFSHGKPVEVDNLRRIESMVNEQIKAELDVYAKEASLADAKQVNALRAVFGEVYPDPVRIVAIGRQVEDLMADPESEQWVSISAELCRGTHISNTREAKAFALLSEEGISKGVRRVTAVTTEYALEAFKNAAKLEQQVDMASRLEGSLLEQVSSLNGQLESASISAAKKADLKKKLSILQNQVMKAKRDIAKENIRIAIRGATQAAEAATADGKAFCVSRVGVGPDTAAIREAVVKVMEEKAMAVMVFSTDERSKKALVCAGVPEQSSHLKVLEWLKEALKPLQGKGGGGKGGLVQGQGSDMRRVDEAIDMAKSFATLILG